jgi:hypothetical protein
MMKKTFEVYDDYGRLLGTIEGKDKDEAELKVFGEASMMNSIDENGYFVVEKEN